MALVDFYQLAVLFNLRRRDAQFLSEHSYPPMSTPAPPRTYASLPHHNFVVPTTPPRGRDPSTVLGLTPVSRGAAIRKGQEGDTDRVDKYDRADYEDYIREDLGCRVFVDYEVFMKQVLHVPDDWKTRWGPAIDAVKADGEFKRHHEQYCKMCNEGMTPEKEFYSPLMETANAVLEVVSRSNFNHIPSERRQYYCVSDPSHLRGGVMSKKNLCPDIVLLHKNRTPPEDTKEKLVYWANPLHVLEVKPYDNAICDGARMPHLIVDGADPALTHAPPPDKLRYREKQQEPPATPTTPTPSNTRGKSKSVAKSTSKARTEKRRAEGSSGGNPRAAKRSKTSSVSRSKANPVPRSKANPALRSRKSSVSRRTLKHGASVQAGGGGGDDDDDEDLFLPEPELKCRTKPAIQVCRYLLEMFSVPLLRSHATAGLVDRDRLQLYHANRSVILVSSAINFSQGDGMDKFIATILAFHCLSLEQNGILETWVPRNAKIISQSDVPDAYVVQKGSDLVFPEREGREEFTVRLGEVISRDPAMIGRSTVVLNATSDGLEGKWEGIPLVVKVSWPTSTREAETNFLEKASKEAKGKHAWALKHIPHLYHAEDVVPGSDSTLERVAHLFDGPKFGSNGRGYVYERRTLRIIIQERLEPFKSLGSVKDVGQVLLDVACVHQWLYKYAGILHRDLSPNNIMCRFIEENNARGEMERRVYGVLTDYDLSSFTATMNCNYKKTSQQRTGTPPYMAHELLIDESPLHLYRHDLESLFCIMLLTAARHTIDTPEGEDKPRVIMRRSRNLPFKNWFNESQFDMLGSLKATFLLKMQPIMLSRTFRDFLPWLRGLQRCFSNGFKRKPSYVEDDEVVPDWMAALTEPGVQPAQFDDETLGGTIKYGTFIAPVRHLTGDLQGLIIRDPEC